MDNPAPSAVPALPPFKPLFSLVPRDVNEVDRPQQYSVPPLYEADVAEGRLLAASNSYEYSPSFISAGVFERWFAWVLDIVIVILVSLLALIPLLGGILVAITGTGYLLMRDHRGASIGKRAMGLRVIGSDGRPANRNALILRNTLLALPYLLHFIPYLGIFLTMIVWIPVCFIESLSTLITGRRIGDRLAGTIVVKN